MYIYTLLLLHINDKLFLINIDYVCLYCIIDTPQLEDELKYRTPLVKELASYSSTPLKPQQVASEVSECIYNGDTKFSVL